MPKAELYLDTYTELAGPNLKTRKDALRAPLTRDSHARFVDQFDVLRHVEYLPTPRPAEPMEDSLKIAVWNVERGKNLDDSANLLLSMDADVNLLSELDVGMARSRQLHTARELAGRLGQGYVYAVEFVELGLGDNKERASFAGSENAAGLHGGAILSPHRLDRPAVIRLEHDGDWWDGERGERRVGGRIAVAAQLPFAGTALSLISVHFESHAGPNQRVEQMAALLDGIELYAGNGPVLIAGDLNSSSMPRHEARDPATLRSRLAEDPGRLIDPVPHEPMFEIAAKAGYDWRSCNAAGATTRPKPEDPPEKLPPHKIDWIFTRGLLARDPAILPAVNAAGEPISDHEALSVTVSLKGHE
jgi:endonuclease/exonuclease/phosphatase family metal-dependent hydrolase